MPQNKTILFTDLGTINYQEARELQLKQLAHIVEQKLAKRQAAEQSEDKEVLTDNYLYFCHHDHVYTLGKNGDPANLLLDQQELKDQNIEFYNIERGGDITYHGPGQLVGYPVLDLENFRTDLSWYLRSIEEVIIRVLADYGVQAGRYQGYTGVWLDAESEDKSQARKIAAIGIKCSRWVSMHGFAFNVNTELSYFSHIVPCGITDRAVTSLQQETGQEIDMQELKNKMLHEFGQVFECQINTALV